MYHAIMGQPPEEASKRQLGDTMLPIEEHMDAFNKSLYHPSFLAGLNAGLTLRPRDRPATIGTWRRILMRGREEEFDEEPEQQAVHPRPGNVDVRRSASPSRPYPSQPLRSQPAQNPRSRTLGTVVRGTTGPAAAGSASAGLTAASVAPANVGIYPERTARIVGYSAILIAAASAVGYVKIGGTWHPDAILPMLVICAGLWAALFERSFALLRADDADFAATAANAAAISVLGFAVYWLCWWWYPLTLLLAAMAVGFAFLRYGSWVPLTLLIVAVLHLACSLFFMLGGLPVGPKSGVLPHPYIWPLLTSCLTVVSLLAIASAIQMQRRSAGLAP